MPKYYNWGHSIVYYSTIVTFLMTLCIKLVYSFCHLSLGFIQMSIIETKFGVFCILEQYSAMWVGSMTMEHIDYIGGPSNKVRLFVLLSIHSG